MIEYEDFPSVKFVVTFIVKFLKVVKAIAVYRLRKKEYAAYKLVLTGNRKSSQNFSEYFHDFHPTLL